MRKLFIAIASLAFFSPIQAQQESLDDLTLTDLVDLGLGSLKARDWKKALEVHAYITKEYGGDREEALEEYGPKFGALWYRRGLAEFQLKQYGDAMKSFAACYADYPNVEGTQRAKANAFAKKALLKWGDAAFAAKQYELAIEKWQKFLDEKLSRDKFQKGVFHINLAIANYNLGKFKEGSENFEIALSNKTTFPTPDQAIAAGLQALSLTAIKAKNEQLLLDFMAKNRGGLTVPAYIRYRYAGQMMAVAGEAMKQKMFRAALSLYQFVPSSQVALNELQSIKQSMGSIAFIPTRSGRITKASIDQQIELIEKDLKNPKSLEIIKLNAIAYIYESLGFVRGAQANYAQLEQFHKNAAGREKHLFQLIRVSSQLGEIKKVIEYSQLLGKLYPESEFLGTSNQMMLSSLFFEGKYKKAIEAASSVLDSGLAAEGTPVHDMALFVLGGSYYYTGQFEQAEDPLSKHGEKYPDSTYNMPSAYFNAGNASRLLQWRTAKKRLDDFLTKYQNETENPYFALALFDRANANFSLDNTPEAQNDLNKLIEEFPKDPITIAAYVLLGNIEEGAGNMSEAEEAYRAGFEAAEALKDIAAGGEPLYFLIATLAESQGDKASEKVKEAVPYADTYWEKYAKGSPYQAQVAVAQLPALKAVGRADEALERLQKVISEKAKKGVTELLEKAINSYTKAYLEKYTADDLREHYYDFPDIDIENKAVLALLRIAAIGAYEDIAKNSEVEKESKAAEIQVKVLFQSLKTDFQLEQLSPGILIKLGDFLRKNTTAPREALPYYDQVLNSEDKEYRFAALMGRADIYGNSISNDDREKAIESLEIVFADSKKKKEREFALYRIIQILMAKEEYVAAEVRAEQYLSKKEGKRLNFRKYSGDVGFMLGNAYKEQGKTEEAISMFTKIFTGQTGKISVSAPAVLSHMELVWKRNKPAADPSDPLSPSDKQGAYNAGKRYLNLTERFKDKMTVEDRKLWDKVQAAVARYVKDPSVKSEKQLKALQK